MDICQDLEDVFPPRGPPFRSLGIEDHVPQRGIADPVHAAAGHDGARRALHDPQPTPALAQLVLEPGEAAAVAAIAAVVAQEHLVVPGGLLGQPEHLGRQLDVALGHGRALALHLGEPVQQLVQLRRLRRDCSGCRVALLDGLLQVPCFPVYFQCSGRVS